MFAHLTSLARLNGLRCVRASVVPDTASSRGSKPGGRYGATVFEVYGGSKAWLAGVERSVKLLNDGGKWRFIQDGPPLPFEDLDAYKARRVKDRFRVALLDKYLGQMGLRPFDEASTHRLDRACSSRSTGPWSTPAAASPLAEARASY